MKKETDDDVAIKVSNGILELIKFQLRDRDDAGRMLAVHYTEQRLWKWFEKLHGRNSDKFPYKIESRLVAHALNEFKLLPQAENQADEDLHQWLQAGVLDLLFVLSQQGHSGGTMFEMLRLFQKLASFEPLSPITDSPDEWEDMSELAGQACWQNKRDSRLISKDAGKTYFNVESQHIILESLSA